MRMTSNLRRQPPGAGKITDRIPEVAAATSIRKESWEMGKCNHKVDGKVCGNSHLYSAGKRHPSVWLVWPECSRFSGVANMTPEIPTILRTAWYSPADTSRPSAIKVDSCAPHNAFEIIRWRARSTLGTKSFRSSEFMVPSHHA